MDFSLTEEQALFQRNVHEFAQKEIAPVAAELDEHARFPHESFRKMADMGLTGLAIPASAGGSDGDHVMVSLAMEEISRACASTGVVLGVTLSLCNHVIYQFGNDEQRNRYIPALSRGERLGAYGLTEPDAGSDAGALRTRARRDGDVYIINGSKQFISNGDQADTLILFTTVDPDQRTRGITAFIVDTKQTPGFTVAKVERKMGIRASSTAALSFEDMAVPVANRLGEEGQGFRIAMQVLDWSRIGIGAQAVGIAQAALSSAVRYAKQRKQFGKTLGEFEAIQFMLADMRVQVEAARLLVLRAANLHDQGKKHTAESSMAKLFASEICEKVTSAAIQIHGGYGYLKDSDVERYYRDSRITQIYEGTSEVQRLVIARETLNA